MKFLRYFTFVFSFLSFSLFAFDLPILSETMDEQAWRNFAKIGCGYYPIPEELKQYLEPTVNLARSLNSSFEGKNGYSSEQKQQIEILFLEKKDWNLYPEETALLAHGMNKIAVSILVNVLKAFEISLDLYPTITGGLSHLEGESSFKLAHYDASKQLPGIPWHKDIRWVTVLFINQEGLQGRVNGEVFAIDPKEGYFVVNLGVFFEAFINDPQKLYALEHQVEQVKKDRVSFGIFCRGNYPQEGFYQLNGEELCWKNPEEMQKFLIEDKDQSFTIGAHKIFKSN